jgi:hypothetical protein
MSNTYKLTPTQQQELKNLFIKFLTEKTPFNDPIFNLEEGFQCYNDTDLNMVLKKFDKALEYFIICNKK